MSVSSEIVRTRAGLRNQDDTEEHAVEDDLDSPLSFVHPLLFLHDQWSIAGRRSVPIAGDVRPTRNLPILGRGLSFTVRAGTYVIEGLGPFPSHVAMKIPNLEYAPSSVKANAETERARSILNEIHILTHQP
ncbi:MAG: hypothetical protein M1840_002130 [Geoglossum simile]|nr:MAG: hypothetical protein M1840_002130 [Geoglossum simile]